MNFLFKILFQLRNNFNFYNKNLLIVLFFFKKEIENIICIINNFYCLFYELCSYFYLDILIIKHLIYIDNFIKKLEKIFFLFELNKMFYKINDINHAFIDIKAGLGGIDAQDFADILFKLYLKWADKHDFLVEILDINKGEIAGIKNITMRIIGKYAFGWLRTETGIHRLVRHSPFNSLNRRHTSFVSVFVYPEIIDNEILELSYKDIKIDTYKAGGVGGQHVNKTDSAVRITHISTGVVVQCQANRSQHLNKQMAIKQLKAKLYKIESLKKENEKKNLSDSKCDITWGRQIRSYIFDQSRVKDLRTNIEINNLSFVLDGGIDVFIKKAIEKGY
ncbi:MAG: peptide chain release factor 2 [Candidatus Azosocius agrarius]|nr:MAG: peptide chain release factor 2 [Gammaproteobacteria bacterium]